MGTAVQHRAEAGIHIYRFGSHSLTLPHAPRHFSAFELVRAGGAHVLDLSHVQDIDSEGVALLLHIWRLARQAGSEVALCGTPEPLNEFLSSIRLLALFNRFPDTSTALNGLSGSRRPRKGAIAGRKRSLSEAA
jgi:ABC-type transporter Mla MlaB component